MQLTLEQLAIISVAASVLVIAIRLIYEVARKQSWVVPDIVPLAIVYAASLGLAALWFPQTLPTWPTIPAEPVGAVGAVLTFIGQAFAVLTAYTAVAAIIYDTLLKKVKDALGWLFAPRVYRGR